MFTQVSIWGVLLAAAAAMVIGMVWYSDALFGKPWKAALNMNDKKMKERMGAATVVLVAVSLLTAMAMAALTIYAHNYLGGSGVMAGLRASLIAGIGFGVTTVFAHGVFDPRETKVLYINAANRLVTIVVMGLIVGAFLK